MAPDAGTASADAPAAAPDESKLREACSACHRFVPPEALPKGMWAAVVPEMYALAGLGDGAAIGVPEAWARAWFEERAPDTLPLGRGALPDPVRLRFRRFGLAPPGAPPTPAIAHVALVDLLGDPRLELLACDMRHGLVLYARPYKDKGLRPIASGLGHPCHAEVTDLDRDGHKDVVVTDLGDFNPGDHEKGRVVLLRRIPGAGFRTLVLATGLARPDDARALDADGDGDLDLVVACFGWRQVGSLVLLENRTEDWGRPAFTPRVLEARPGAVDVPVADLDMDGRLDVVTVIAQHHEEVVGFFGADGGRLARRLLHAAPHAAWGSNGVSVADLDRDGDPDLLLTNGDTLDDHLLKPYHGVRWLENAGDGRFAAREVGSLYGVHDAVAADLDGDGDADVVAGTFLPQIGPEIREVLRVESLVWFEHTAPGRFERRVLEGLRPVHATIAVGDYDLDGDQDLAVGQFKMGAGDWDDLPYWVELWESRLK